VVTSEARSARGDEARPAQGEDGTKKRQC
jgi:hypothetical protein